MDVQVVVIVLVVAVAEFIADPFAHILQRVDEMHFPEQLQGTENVGFINRVKTLLQFAQGQGPGGIVEGAGNQEPVCRHFYAVPLHEGAQFFR
jgi:hypothetical protein